MLWLSVTHEPCSTPLPTKLSASAHASSGQDEVGDYVYCCFRRRFDPKVNAQQQPKILLTGRRPAPEGPRSLLRSDLYITRMSFLLVLNLLGVYKMPQFSV